MSERCLWYALVWRPWLWGRGDYRDRAGRESWLGASTTTSRRRITTITSSPPPYHRKQRRRQGGVCTHTITQARSERHAIPSLWSLGNNAQICGSNLALPAFSLHPIDGHFDSRILELRSQDDPVPVHTTSHLVTSSPRRVCLRQPARARLADDQPPFFGQRPHPHISTQTCWSPRLGVSRDLGSWAHSSLEIALVCAAPALSDLFLLRKLLRYQHRLAGLHAVASSTVPHRDDITAVGGRPGACCFASSLLRA